MKTYQKLLPLSFMAIAGGIMGGMAVNFSTKGAEEGVPMPLIPVGLLCGGLLALYLQLILHEAGHLIFGLLSGYKFVSFRIGSLLFYKEDGRLKTKRYSLAGTGGQCLMSPPDFNGGNYPYALYNMVGVIVNLILAAIFGAIYFAFKPSAIFGYFCLSMMVLGIAMAMTNGIPLKTNMVTNDGYNALHLNQDMDALKSFWVTLKVNEKQMEGMQLSAMDPDWLTLSEGADLKNAMVTPLLGMRENLLMEQRDFDGAKALIDKLLSRECALNGLQENLLKLDGLYIHILKNGAAADLSLLEDKGMMSFMQAMKNYPAILRTKYAAAKVKGDEEGARSIKEKFERMAKSYPYSGEIETERRLMEEVEKLTPPVGN